MGRMKEIAIDQQELEEGQKQVEEYEAAQQEAYYWYILQEFLAINKVFGQAKVLGDLKTLRETVEGKEDKPRILTLNDC